MTLDFKNTIFTLSCDICSVILMIKSTGSSSAIKESDYEGRKQFRILCEDCLYSNFKYRIEKQLEETVKKAEEEQLSRIHKKKLERFKDSFYE